MRIWHQSLTVIEDLPAYADRLRAHITTVARPDTEVVLHGLLPGTYPANYPGDDIAYGFLFAMHSLQWPVHALNAERQGFDAFAMCSLPDPMLREIRSIVDIPVVGCGETCFHLASMMGERFGMLLFIERMAARYLDQIRMHGLAERCVGVRPVGFRFHDVLAAFDGSPGPLIDRFKESARAMIADGADVIIPGEIPLNLLLATEGVREIDGVPLLDSLGLTIKMAETFVDLKATTGFAPSRRGWRHATPARERVLQVLDFYGLGRFLSEN